MKMLFKLSLFILSLALLPLTSCNAPSDTSNIKSISLDKTSLNVSVGDSDIALKATITPIDSSKKFNDQFTIKLSDFSIIRLNTKKGMSGQTFSFSALKEGSVDLTVTTMEGNFTSTCKINVSSSGGGEDVIKRDVYVIYYLDYNQVDSFYSYKARTGDLVNRPDKAVSDNMAPDSAFPHFLGWSAHPLIDDPKDLWNFEEDRIEGKDRVRLYLYGIWVEA